MRKIALLLLCSLLFLSACQKQPAEPPVSTNPETQPTAASPILPVEITFDAQYIRTGGYEDTIRYPVVQVITSREALQTYYESSKELYALDGFSTEDPGFWGACSKYDDAYFRDRFLLMVLTQAGSGSTRFQVDSLEMTDDGQLTVAIHTEMPEIGTADMAQWHILIEPEAGIPAPDEVFVYLNGELAYNGHAHQLAEVPETVENPNTGYCGNTVVTAKIRGTEYPISGEQAITLLHILENLQYSPHKICKCLPEYTIVAEAVPYGIHLTQGYARCEAGQAALTREQVQTIQIILQNVVGGDLHSPFKKTDE